VKLIADLIAIYGHNSDNTTATTERVRLLIVFCHILGNFLRDVDEQKDPHQFFLAKSKAHFCGPRREVIMIVHDLSHNISDRSRKNIQVTIYKQF